MWIIPSTLPQYSLYAQECVASKQELKELSEASLSLPMWKSKPSSLKTLSSKWNRVYWLRHLCGRMLRPSMYDHFVTSYASSLVAIPANQCPSPVSLKDLKTLGTCGRQLSTSLENRGLLDASLKMSRTTYESAMTVYARICGEWVTRLKKDYLARKRLVRHKKGSDYSSSLFPTPSASMSVQGMNEHDGKRGQTLLGAVTGQDWPTATINGNNNQKGISEKAGDGLNTAVKNWATPTVLEQNDTMETWEKRAKKMKEKHGNGNGAGMGLALMVRNWSTPAVTDDSMYSHHSENRNSEGLAKQTLNWSTPMGRDYKSPDQENTATFKRKQLRGNVELPSEVALWGTPRTSDSKDCGEHGSHSQKDWVRKSYVSGQVKEYMSEDRDQSNGRGSRLALSPAWVAQLMGTTIEKIFFECSAMELSNRQPK